MSVPSSALAAVTLAAAACAHAPGGWTHESIATSTSNVVLRYAAVDRVAAAQIRAAVRVALPMAERWGSLGPEVSISIHPTHEALEEAAGRSGPWMRAWAREGSVEVQSPRTWSRGFATDEELIQLLAHELTHCAMFRAIGGDARLAEGIPAWFREGMATSNAGERFAVIERAAAPVTSSARLQATRLPYATADQAFRFLVVRFGVAHVRLILARMHAGLQFADAFHEVTGMALSAFEQEFGAFDEGIEVPTARW